METNYRRAAMVAAALLLPVASPAMANKPKVLVSLKAPGGSAPQGALVADAKGDLYGTNQSGGASGKGNIFKLSPPAAGKTAWVKKVLLTFNGTNGSEPVAGLVFDKSGNLYGTALTGGASGDGAVFELVAPAAGKTIWTEKLLVSFNGTNGQNPQAGVIFDASGNLYGATVGGGASSAGTVFKLAPPAAGGGAWTLSTLFSFNGTTTGDVATGTLILDKSGNIYGTTVDGGSANDGIAFKLSPASGTSWNETVLANFSAGNGIHPYSGLVEDSSGNLYGTTVSGGASNEGAVFKLAMGSGSEQVLVSFDGNDGNYPFANLAIDTSGNLYGATGGGGKHGNGTIFEVTPPVAGKTAWTETVLTSFTGANGSGPSAAVLLGSDGALYGTTVNGGKHNNGTVFKLEP